MIIYLCIKFESNTPIFSKDIKWKPFFNYFSIFIKGHNSKNNWWIFTLNRTWPIFYNYMLVYNIWIQYTNLFKSYGPETIFQSRKRAITPKIIDGFYSKSSLTYILWLYTCVQNFNPTYQPFQKISHGNPFSKLKRAITPKIMRILP